MRSFASIATFATLAFASVASALPVFNAARAPGAIDVSPKVGVVVAHDVATIEHRSVLDATIAGVSVDVERRGDQLSVIEIVSEVVTTVTPICQKITDTVSAQGVDINAVLPVVLDLLGDVVAVLTKAKTDIEAAISSGVVPLLLNGKVLDLGAVAKLVGALICTIIQCLGIVFKVVGGAHKEVLTIIGTIGAILGEIIALVLKVAGGLLFRLLPIVGPVLTTVLFLGLHTLSSVLTIRL